MKRLKLSLFFLLVMLFSSSSVWAEVVTVASRVDIGELKYNIYQEGDYYYAEIIGTAPQSNDPHDPEYPYYPGYPHDPSDPEGGNKNITKVTIPESVEYENQSYNVVAIGNSAFEGCRKLTSVNIPASIKNIGMYAFHDCEELASVTFNDGLESIDNAAFWLCEKLNNVVIPKTVNSIGETPFLGCKSLTSLRVAEGNQVFESPNDCNAIIRKSDKALIQGSNATVIPSSVEIIYDRAFEDFTGITDLVIPEGVKSIGMRAFGDCDGLKTIKLPSSIVEIKASAFAWCDNIEKIYMSATSVPTTNSYAFYQAQTNFTVYFPYSARTSYRNASVWKDLNLRAWNPNNSDEQYVVGKVVTKHASVTMTVGEESGETGLVFDVKSGVSAQFVLTVDDKYVFDKAEYSCGSAQSIWSELTNQIEVSGDFDITVYTSRYITDNNIRYKEVDDVNKTASVIALEGEKKYSGTINVPSSFIIGDDEEFRVVSISDNAFKNCTELTKVILPSGITNIGSSAFEGCSSLSAIYAFAASVPETGANALSDCLSSCNVFVPKSAVDGYKNNTIWSGLNILSGDPETLTAVANQGATTYYATFSDMFSDVELIPETGCTLKVYNATVTNGQLQLEPRNDNKVAKGEGVLVCSTSSTININVITGESALEKATYSNNNLVAAGAETSTVEADEGYKLFRLTFDNVSQKTGLGFYLSIYQGSDNGKKLEINPNKAYLLVSVSSLVSNVSLRGFAIDDNETTAIYELPNAKVTNVQVGKSYNLNGQRVGNATNGLIVRDGKKIIVNNQ